MNYNYTSPPFQFPRPQERGGRAARRGAGAPRGLRGQEAAAAPEGRRALHVARQGVMDGGDKTMGKTLRKTTKPWENHVYTGKLYFFGDLHGRSWDKLRKHRVFYDV